MIVYAIRMTDQHYVTLYPNFAAIWPAIVLQAMLLTRRNIILEKIDDKEEEEGEEERSVVRASFLLCDMK